MLELRGDDLKATVIHQTFNDNVRTALKASLKCAEQDLSQHQRHHRHTRHDGIECSCTRKWKLDREGTVKTVFPPLEILLFFHSLAVEE